MTNPMTRQLEKRKAALAAYKVRFPVLVLDGDASRDVDAFRATLYGEDREPVDGAEDMTHAEAKAYFMERVATRAEWDAECARAATYASPAPLYRCYGIPLRRMRA